LPKFSIQLTYAQSRRGSEKNQNHFFHLDGNYTEFILVGGISKEKD